jgi:hypothetical protein
MLCRVEGHYSYFVRMSLQRHNWSTQNHSQRSMDGGKMILLRSLLEGASYLVQDCNSVTPLTKWLQDWWLSMIAALLRLHHQCFSNLTKLSISHTKTVEMQDAQGYVARCTTLSTSSCCLVVRSARCYPHYSLGGHGFKPCFWHWVFLANPATLNF